MKEKSYIFRRSILDGVSFALFVSVILSIVYNPTDEDLLNLNLVSSIFLFNAAAFSQIR